MALSQDHSALVSWNESRLITSRVVRSEISGNLLITYVNQLFASPTLQSDAVK